jgi:hypothetical protein
VIDRRCPFVLTLLVTLFCAQTDAKPSSTSGGRFLKVTLQELHGHARDSVHQIQSDFRTIYKGDPQWRRDSLFDARRLDDSLIGPSTVTWLQRFCIDFRVAGRAGAWKDLVWNLQRIASLQRRDPSVVNVLISPDFLRWSQVVEDRRNIDSLISRGMEDDLRKVVQRYRDDWGHAKQWPQDTVHSHVLDIKGLAKLKSRDNLQKALRAVTFPVEPPYDGLVYTVKTALEADSSRFLAVWAKVRQTLDDVAMTADAGFREEDIDDILDTLGGPQLPTPLLDLLMEIDGVEYPDAYDLRQAAYGKFVAGMGICMGDVRPDNAYLHSVRFDSAGFGLVDSLLREDALARFSGEVEDRTAKNLEIIRSLRLENLVCNDTVQRSGKDALQMLFDNFLVPNLDKMAPTVRLHQKTDSVLPPVERCACVRTGLAGTVYGLYPPRESAKGPLDYGVLSRIAYFGIGFDEKGVLHYLNDLGSDPTDFSSLDIKRRDFVRLAHEHGTRVDWVLAKDDWGKDWSRLSIQERSNLLSQVTSSLVKHLTTVLSDPLSKAMPWLSFGHTRAETRGDGVIIYFRNYPDDQQLEGSSALLKGFVRDLQDRLARDGGGYQVSLMVLQRQLESESDAFRPKSILDMFDTSRNVSQARIQSPTAWMDLPGDQKDSIKQVADSLLRVQGSNGNAVKFTHIADSLTQVLADVGAKNSHGSWSGPRTLGQCRIGGQLLVVLEEPTSDAKKRLRQLIEKSLRGSERVKLLRSTVPVLNFDHRNWGQLADDLIYFKDNFGGVAFWPWVDSGGSDTALSCGGAKSLVRCLELTYFDGPPPDHAATGVAKLGAWFEHETCPNRWIIRVLILVLSLVLATFLGLAVFVDAVRRRVRPVFPWLLCAFVLPPLFLFLLLVLYDPELAFLTAGKGPLIGAILLLVAGFLGTAIVLQRRRVVPSRPALRAFLDGHK